MDEPTNHLDLDSKEVLENALIDYPGTILFVSHDRYFINRIATKVLELNRKGATEFLGDYDYFIEKKLEQEELKALAALEAKATNTIANDSAKQDKNSYQQDKEAKRLERQRKRRMEEVETAIEELELEVAEYEERLCDPNVFQDHEKAAEYTSKIEKAKEKLEELMEEWTELA